MNGSIINRRLLIHFVTGADGQGNDIIRTRTINHVRPTATAQQMESFALNFSSLSDHTHLRTVVADYYQLESSSKK